MKTNKSVTVLLAACAVSLLTACATSPVAVAPVGPNPAGFQTASSSGQLEVFSRLTGRREGDNPTWKQHTSYAIYMADGRLLKHVDNTVGYYAAAPRVVSLQPGHYLVKAQSKDYLVMTIPVTIESGRTTRVHLDDNWTLPPNTSKNQLVSMPDGIPVGWQAPSDTRN